MPPRATRDQIGINFRSRARAARRSSSLASKIREEHRQKRQIRENDGGDTEAGGDGNFLDDLYVDQRDRDESDGIRGKSHGARQKETANARPRGVQPIRTIRGLRAHRADHLHAVADTDREHQERHEDGHRIDAESERREPAKLPDDGDERARQRRNGQTE